MIWSTNPLERVNKEIKRRTDVVGVFPNPAALLRLAGCVLIEVHDEWQVSDNADGIEPQDVSISYAVHPWARGQGVAVEAVRLICNVVRTNDVGTRAAIRVERENTASVRVAEKSGFRYIRDFPSTMDTHADGTPTTFSLYLLDR